MIFKGRGFLYPWFLTKQEILEGESSMKFKTKKLASLAMATALLATSAGLVPASAGEFDDKNYIELMGSDRYQTAIQLSKHTFAKTASAVVIASGESYPDALAGSSLASILHAPLILTNKNTIKQEVLLELSRLQPKSTYILGGRDTISESVEKEVKNIHDNVIRLNGKDRYDTSVKIAEKVRALTDNKVKDTVIVSGKNFPDALSAGALGAKLKAPLILTNGKNLPEGYEKVMNKSDKKLNTIIGGPNSVDISDLYADRISGSDRYATSSALATRHFAKSATAVIASGLDYPDGLSSITLYNNYQMPILLSNKVKLDASVASYMNLNDVKTGILVGGTNSIGYVPRREVKEIVDRNKFKVKAPSILGPVEDADTSIRVNLNERPARGGLVELYKLDKDGKIGKEVYQSGSYPANAQNTILNIGGFIVKKGDKFVARRVEEINKVKEYSAFTPVVTAGENIPTAEKQIDKILPLEVTMSESESNNQATVVNALRDAIKKKNTSSSYKVDVENYYKDLSLVRNGKRFGKINVTVSHLTKSSDYIKRDIDFTINIVSNSVDRIDITTSGRKEQVRDRVNGNDFNFYISLHEDGKVADADKKIKCIALSKAEGSTTEEQEKAGNCTITQDGSNTSKYTGRLSLAKDHAVGTVRVIVSSAKNPSVQSHIEFKLIKNRLNGLDVKKDGKSLSSISYDKLGSPISFEILPVYEGEFELGSLEIEKTDIKGEKIGSEKFVIETSKSADGKSYTATLTDNNKDLPKQEHSFILNLKYKDTESNKYVEKSVEFKYLPKASQ